VANKIGTVVHGLEIQKQNDMKQNDFHTSIAVDATAHQAFEAINNVSKWWTENLKGSSHKLNDEFTVQFGDVHYSKQKIVELIQDKKVVWLVTESKLNFITNKQEWTNTKIIFEISVQNGKTKIDFTHPGLVPGIECFDTCSNSWVQIIQRSLFSLITTGKGIKIF